ncbi:MAG: ABC transporter permease, partial [Hyphomicrobiales bacterium]|nr:ABC transporter permease [Hyphomicrobiales bacterium]
MILSRLVALEREQIGLLKAVGYGNFTVGLHYLQFVGVIAIVGSLIGIAVGTWFGVGLTRLYGDYFHFPFLLFEKNLADYVTAVAITLVAASVGAVKAVLGVVRLSPAVAMAPPAPSRYKRLLRWPEKWRTMLPQTVVMITRHLLRWPLRTGSTILGIALGVSILVASLWTLPSIEFMIDVTFYQTERQDGSIVFVGTRRISSLYEIARLPGVMTAEPYRSLAVKIRNGPIERRIAITGKPQTSDLSRILDGNFEPVRLPEQGVAISDKLADILGVHIGDIVEIELMEGPRQTAEVAVTAVIPSFIGLSAYMNLDAVNALAREGALINGVNITFDEKVENDLYAALSDIPSASFIALQKISILKFRETMAQNILIMVAVYIGFASVIAFGVVYNAARISLSERGRELA